MASVTAEAVHLKEQEVIIVSDSEESIIADGWKVAGSSMRNILSEHAADGVEGWRIFDSFLRDGRENGILILLAVIADASARMHECKSMDVADGCHQDYDIVECLTYVHCKDGRFLES